MADGKIKIDVELNAKKAEQGAKKLSEAFEKTKTTMENSVKLDIDLSQAEKELKQVEKELEKFKKKRAELYNREEYKAFEKEWKDNEKERKAEADFIDRPENKYGDKEGAHKISTIMYDEKGVGIVEKYKKLVGEMQLCVDKIETCTARQAELKQIIEQTKQAQAQENALTEKASENFNKTKEAANKTKNEIEQTTRETRKGSKETQKEANEKKKSRNETKKDTSEKRKGRKETQKTTGETKKQEKSTKRTSKHLSDFNKKMRKFSSLMKGSLKPADNLRKKFTKIGLALLGARSIFVAFKQVISEAMSNNEKLQNQLTAAKGVLGEALAPAISLMVNLLSQAVTFADMIYQTFTGTSLIAKYNAKQAQKQADATQDAADAAEEYQKQLAGFDVANKLGDNSSSSSSTSSGSTSSSENPMFESVPIDDWLQEIIAKFEAKDFTGLGSKIAQKISDGLSTIPWAEIKKKAFGSGKSFADTLNGLFSYTDKDGKSLSENLGNSLGEALNTAVQAGLGSVENFNWRSNGKQLSKGFNECVRVVEWDKVGKLIGDSIKGILEGIDEFIKNVDGDKVGESLGEVIKNIDWGGIIIDLLYIVTDSLKLAFDTVTGLFDELGADPDQLADNTEQFCKDFVTWIKTSLLPALLSAIKAAFSVATNGNTIKEAILQGIFQAIFGGDSEEDELKAKWAARIVNLLVGGITPDKIATIIKEHISGKNGEDGTSINLTANLEAKASEKFKELRKQWIDLGQKGKSLVASFKAKKTAFFEKVRKQWQDLGKKGKTLVANFKAKKTAFFDKVRTQYNNLRNKSAELVAKAKQSEAFKNMKKKWDSVQSKAATVTANLKDNITSGIRNILTSMCNMINKVIGVLNGVLPSKWEIDYISPPKLARGGIVNVPGRGVTARIGEAGAEAVLPLENNTGWMDLLAERLANKINAGGGVIQTIITLDGETIAKKITKVNGRRNIRMNGGVI